MASDRLLKFFIVASLGKTKWGMDRKWSNSEWNTGEQRTNDMDSEQTAYRWRVNKQQMDDVWMTYSQHINHKKIKQRQTDINKQKTYLEWTNEMKNMHTPNISGINNMDGEQLQQDCIHEWMITYNANGYASRHILVDGRKFTSSEWQTHIYLTDTDIDMISKF